MTGTAAATFRLGINYWPAASAMSWWQHFDRAEVERDFKRIAQAGFDSVRIFLTWEDFQPSPTKFNQACINQLIQTFEVAHAAGLVLMPTLFTGHMSGVNWIPPWALGQTSGDARFRVIAGGKVVESRLASWYSDSAITQAQCALARELASAVHGHPALWAWDLGNENSNCGAAPNKISGRNWLQQICNAIHGSDANAKITIGLHMEDLEHDRNLGPAEAAEFCDFLTMHGYPAYAPWTAGATDERLLPFLTRLTACLSGDAEVLFSEFGVPTLLEQRSPESPPQPTSALVSEQDAASYVGRALHSLQHCGSSGAMLWCYTDYAPALYQTPPFDLAIHERSFGLWRADASPKPAVNVVQSFAQQRNTLPPPKPLAHDSWFDIDVQQFYQSPETELPRLYGRYCSAKALLNPALSSGLQAIE